MNANLSPEEINQGRKDAEALEYRQLMGVDPRREHMLKMATSREYAIGFLKESAPAGAKFTIGLEVVDEYETHKVWEFVRSLIPPTEEEQKAGKKPPIPILLHGCKVMAIYNIETGHALLELKQKLTQLAK